MIARAPWLSSCGRLGLMALAAGAGMGRASAAWAASAAQDQAGDWLGFLFSGKGLAEAGSTAGPLPVLAVILRQALGAYSVTMLVVAGLLLAWQVASMVAETAHTGVVMGRRTNQLWVPLRFLFGISLLMPLGGGLCAGQALIVKIAQQGSAAASSLWQDARTGLGWQFGATAAPQALDPSGLALAALEMETCRALYHQAFAAHANDPIVAMAGDMADFQKMPASGLGDESWIYTNSFFPQASLCGAYRFYPIEAASDGKGEAWAEASRLMTERLAMQSRMAAERLLPSLAGGAPGDTAALSAIVKEQSALLKGQMAHLQNSFMPKEQESNAQRGWIESGFFLWQQISRQVAAEDLARRTLPRVSPPLLGHAALTRGDWFDAARTEPGLRTLLPSQFEAYVSLYDRTARGLRQARAFLAAQAVRDGLTPLPDQQDLADRLAAFADASAGVSALDRLMRQGAQAFGLWSPDGKNGDQVFGGGLEAFWQKPFQLLTAQGAHLWQFGHWAFGALGPALFHPATATTGFLFALESLAFVFAGFLLLYVVPFLPLLRFFIAVMEWGVAVFSGIVSLPLIALAHLYPAGEGFSGPVARRAYWRLLALFLQPMAIVFGFIGGLALFCLAVALLYALLGDGFDGQASWSLWVVLTVIRAVFVTALASVCFLGVTLLPRLLLVWVGGGDLSELIVPAQPGAAGAPSVTVTPLLGAPPSGRAGPSKSSAAPSPQTAPAARAPTTMEAALFPSVHEQPAAAVVIAKAAARAEARAEGKDGASAEAMAAAGASQSDQAYVHTQAMSRQIIGDEKTEKRAASAGLLPPQPYGKAEKEQTAKPPEQEQAEKKAPSAEQSAATKQAEERAVHATENKDKP